MPQNDDLNDIGIHSPLLFEARQRAMATLFEVLLPLTDAPAHAEAAVDALGTAEQLENLLSIYRPGSEISRVNALPVGTPARMSRDTLAVLERALEFYRATGGAFDVTAGPLVQAWGFTQRTGRRPSAEEIEQALQRVGSDAIRIDSARQTVALDRPEMAINLGAIGKGFAIDRICSQLVADGLMDFCVHAGNSSIAARGTMGGEVYGWNISLRHPTQSNEILGRIRLADRALGTSGSGKQFFHFKGERYGHVIDPRTGWPAGDLLSLTVLAVDATAADALATGLFVAGSDEACRFAEQHPEIGIIGVAPAKRAGDVRIVTRNVDEFWQPTSGTIVADGAG